MKNNGVGIRSFYSISHEYRAALIRNLHKKKIEIAVKFVHTYRRTSAILITVKQPPQYLSFTNPIK